MDQRSLPLGYSFLGNEPDSSVCCDLNDCPLQMQSVDYKRLNCGHSFHLASLRERERDENVSDRAHCARLCPICHPFLEARIRELSTTMNRLVRKSVIFKQIRALARRLTPRESWFRIYFPPFLCRYLAGEELGSDESVTESDDEDDDDDDDDPQNFKDPMDEDNSSQKENKVDELRSKLNDRATLPKENGQVTAKIWKLKAKAFGRPRASCSPDQRTIPLPIHRL